MNNFDQSSSGVNLELNVSFDADRANHDFEVNFHVLQYNSYRQNSVLVFSQFGNFDVTEFALTGLNNYKIEALTTKQIFKAFYNYQYPTNIDHDLKCLDFTCIKELMQNLQIENLNTLDQSEILEAIETDLYCDDSFQEFLKATFTCNYLVMESRGYSQGDYAQIIIPAQVLESYKDQTLEQIENTLQGVIDHLLWDQPLYARLTIDEEEFYIDEHLKDEYQYDQDEIKQILTDHLEHEQKEFIINWVVDNLPDHPKCY